MTEDEILTDLLVRRFHDEHLHRLLNPGEAEIEDLAADPDESGRMLERAKNRSLKDPSFVRALQALGVGAKTIKAPPAGERRLSVRTSPMKKERVAP